MTVETTLGIPIDAQLLHNYFRNLVNHFFKILPIREKETESLPVYMRSLQAELLGCKELISAVQYDSCYLTLITILQYLIDNPSCPISDVKREVFRAISICNKLKARYAIPEVTP